MSEVTIRLMKDRRREMIPIDNIRVMNSRTRDEGQFALNVQSIDSIGQIKDIRVNAHRRLGRTHIRAEVVTCSRKQAHLESLVENLARTRPGTMYFARELKALHDEGWDYDQIARIACRSVEYIRQYIRLAENGEDRLIQGVEQDVFPISFAVLVAQADDSTLQNVLMDAFDQGIVNSNNFARARAIIKSRMDRP